MTNKNEIKLFQNSQIRTKWDSKIEDYYFSIIDVIAVLTESKNPSQYWRTLKSRLKEEGGESVTNCNRLKMPAADGKLRLTDVATTKQLLRIIQSIPSPKAEPFKQWLAQLGKERLDEIADPEQAIERAIYTYRKKGYSEELVLNMLAEVSTTEISRNENPNGLNESKYVAKRGGNIAGNARKYLESQLGKKLLVNIILIILFYWMIN